MPPFLPPLLALVLLASGVPDSQLEGVTGAAPEAVERLAPRASLVAGRGTRILEIDGRPPSEAETELAPGVHVLRFESRATVEPVPGRRSRVIHEICEARFRARSGAAYVVLQQVIASRGVQSWHHQLASFVHDEQRDRAVGECVCRTAPLE